MRRNFLEIVGVAGLIFEKKINDGITFEYLELFMIYRTFFFFHHFYIKRHFRLWKNSCKSNGVLSTRISIRSYIHFFFLKILSKKVSHALFNENKWYFIWLYWKQQSNSIFNICCRFLYYMQEVLWKKVNHDIFSNFYNLDKFFL